jgi:hypothetical protein
MGAAQQARAVRPLQARFYGAGLALPRWNFGRRLTRRPLARPAGARMAASRRAAGGPADGRGR